MQSVQLNIFQRSKYQAEGKWTQIHKEYMVQEKQKKKNQKSFILFEAYSTYLSEIKDPQRGVLCSVRQWICRDKGQPPRKGNA